MKTLEKITYRGFQKGYNQLTLKDKSEVTIKLWEALGIKNRNTFFLYRTGKIEPKVSQAMAVEEVFGQYGIIEIWD